MRLHGAFVLLAIVVLLSACSRPEEEPRAPLTERQRDSTLAESGLPGASAVGRALAVSDTAAARAAREVPQSP